MSRTDILVKQYMTPQPLTVTSDESLEQAVEMMKRNGIRHLPVLKNGELLGVLSDRDVKTAAGVRGADPKRMQVADVCSNDAYVTHPDAHLKYVAQEMADKRYGSTVVMQTGQVVGIVTTTDIARALAQTLS